MKHRSPRLAAALLAILTALSACSPAPTSGEPEQEPAAEQTQETAAEPEFVIPEDTVVSFVDYTEIFQARSGLERLSSDSVTLMMDGVPVPHAGLTCYLTVDDSFRMTDLYSLTAEMKPQDPEQTEPAKPLIKLDQHMAEVGLEPLMKHNTSSEVFVYTDSGYVTLNLVFTTLPVVTVTSKSSHISTTPKGCTFELFSYRNGGSKVSFIESDGTIKVRGASSSSLAKTGFKVELQKDGESRKMPLLGMRNDDDWILYPSYSDNSKIRDVVGWHLWEKMMEGRDYGGVLQTRYVEMILNGEYYGLYVLMEKFDEKTLGLKDGDALFKCISWDVPTGDQLRRQGPASEAVSSIEKKFPDPADKVDGSWDVFADYVAISYETDGSEFKKKILDVADFENQLDYWLFLNITMACDNTWKNTYYAEIDGKIRAYPWDLDITFGLGWSGIFEENYLWEDPNTTQHTYDFQCGRRLIKYVDGAADYIKQRWKQLKADGIADAETLSADAHELWDMLHSCGAFQRNLDRWPNTSATDSLDYFDKTVRAREAWLNDYIGGLN